VRREKKRTKVAEREVESSVKKGFLLLFSLFSALAFSSLLAYPEARVKCVPFHFLRAAVAEPDFFSLPHSYC
jgi:hypothetical protein